MLDIQNEQIPWTHESVLTSSVSIVIFSSSGFSITRSSFIHWSVGRGSPFTSAGMSIAEPFFTMMALLLKNFRMVMVGATADKKTCFCKSLTWPDQPYKIRFLLQKWVPYFHHPWSWHWWAWRDLHPQPRSQLWRETGTLGSLTGSRWFHNTLWRSCGLQHQTHCCQTSSSQHSSLWLGCHRRCEVAAKQGWW